jgi:NAD(P)-dependent dehydrogenase (short-subunit alcohol dehydrogenase family)
MRLKDKVAFISGGARGIGAAIAKLFAREGAKVVIGDVLEEEGRKTETEINETGGESLFLRMDVTSEDEWQQAVASTLARFGKLDVLVNNAGIGDTGKVEDTTVEAWDRVMEVNAKGVFLGTKAAIPELRRSGGGSIINISSQVGLVGTETASPQYQASKGAVRMLTKATAIQYAGEGIRANSVHPGPIITPMLEASDDREMNQLLLSRIPLKKYGEPDNVAFGVLLLASDESCFMTGSEMVIDGGYTAW